MVPSIYHADVGRKRISGRGFWLLILLCFSVPVGFSQNLVPNPDFSLVSSCPTSPGQISLSYYWYSPNTKTTDIIHGCGTRDVGVPNNRWGQQRAYAGNGYAGIRTWLDPESSLTGTNYREYLAIALVDSLISGEIYFVSFRLSLAENAQYTSDDIGLAFSSDRPQSANVLPLQPAISNTQGSILFNQFEWTEISGFYTAKGGEKHLIIGNFLPDSQTTVIRRPISAGEPDDPTVYFYIDQVTVEPCQGRFPEKLILAEDTLLCPDATTTLSAASLPGALYTWEDGSNQKVRNLSPAGTYFLTLELFGCQQTDSIQIGERSFPDLTSFRDTLLCPGEELVLDISDSSATYVWNQTQLSQSWTIATAGIYSPQISSGPCKATPSFQVSYAPPLPLSAIRDTLVCIEAGALTLMPRVAFASAYRWQNGSTQSSLTVQEAGTYTVFIETPCSEGEEIFEVQTQICSCTASLPNTFTPNGDGVNDLYLPELSEGAGDFHLQIVDRWGSPCFQSSSIQTGWDGTHRGNTLPAGVYFWALSYTCTQDGSPRQVQQSGNLLLLR